MISVKTFRQLALSFQEVVEQSHFEKASFRVKKKIFVTLDEPNHRICVKLSPTGQSVFSLIDKRIIWAVPNKWGQQGWTFVDLKRVKKELLKDVLTNAYCEVAPTAWAAVYQK
jgi:predicted DNA-binding protein (MmcQ/YjbR family)